MHTIFVLTHWGRDQIAVIFLTTFSNAFFLTKMYQCQLKFHWSSFLKARLTKFYHWFRKWLGADQATSHYLNQWWFDYRRIYASLGLNKLILIMEANSLYLTWPVHNVSFICHPYGFIWTFITCKFFIGRTKRMFRDFFTFSKYAKINFECLISIRQ